MAVDTMTRRWPDMKHPQEPDPFLSWIFMAIFVGGLVLAFMTFVHAATVKASTYDEDKYIANGQRYDPKGITAAHRSLPFGTQLTVRYGHRAIVLTINDRGPAEWTRRDIDLSAGSAKALGFPGTGRVRIESWPPLPRPRP